MRRYLYLLFFLFIGWQTHAQQKRIYIANDDHTDYMWSGDEEAYKNAFLETLDYYIKLNDSTAHLPYNQQSKWNCDGSYWVHIYKQNRSKKQFDKLISQIKRGQITVPLNTLIVLLGAAPAEATLRNMYYAGSLKRQHGLDLNLVLNMEDQVLPLGLSSLWAGAGGKYSWRGVCACASGVTGLENRKNQMYWYKGLDDQKVLMKWYAVNPSMITNRKEYRYNLGNYLEANNLSNAIIDCKAKMQEPIYPYSISGAFGKGGDDLKTLTNVFPKVAKENTDSTYQIIVSNEIDFFKDFEKQYGASLPSETISYGSTEWGNSYASLAEVSASVKRSIEKLRTAESIYTMVALKDKNFALDLIEQKERAWMACGLYFEHNWTADGPHITRKQRADWQRKIANQLNSYVDTLYNRSVAMLGQLIVKSPNTTESFYVFNPLSWARTDYSDYLYNGNVAAIKVIDKTNQQEIPFQAINKKEKSYLRIWADNVPSLGYKVFEIQLKTKENSFTSNKKLSVTDSTLENSFYKIKFTKRGVITSLVEKTSNKQYVKPFEKLYFNDLGSGLANEDGKVTTENQGDVSVTVSAFSYKPLKHTTKITLFANNNRIEIENYITQNTGEKPVTYAFSLNLDKPDTWHEEAGAILRAKSISKGGHYADSANRLDWLALNHFTDISDTKNGVVISNRDAYFMKIGNSTSTKLDDSTAHIKVLATGRIDPYLGMENQDGDTYFENFLALQPHEGGLNTIEAMRFSLQHQNPLIAQKITGGIGYDGKQFSMLSISDKNVIVWALKPAEDGIEKGVIVRAWNLADANKSITISTNTPLKKAFSTTHIETDDQNLDIQNGKLNTTIGHNRIQTFRLNF